VAKPICIFIVASALIASAWALTLSQDDEHARDSALQWLQVIDSGNYKDAALMISEQVSMTRDWTNYLSANRALLGRLNKRLIVEVKHRSTIPGAAEIRNYDMIRFKTSFERKPVAFEEVVIAKIGCCWEIFGYEIK
jgi:hypothetical protein